jgi:hypothetical protein
MMTRQLSLLRVLSLVAEVDGPHNKVIAKRDSCLLE